MNGKMYRMKHVLTLVFIHLLFIAYLPFNICAQKVKIKFQIDGYDNDTLLIGNYFGNKTLVKDTLIAEKKQRGSFVWIQDTLVPPGVYLALLKPDHKYIQFLVNEKPDKLKISFSASDLLNVTVTGCKENEGLYAYLRFLGDKRVMKDTINNKLEKTKNDTQAYEKLKKDLTSVDQDVKRFQTEIINNNKGSVLELLISSNLDIEVPSFTGDEKSVQLQRYYYYKNHYFDNISFQHPALIRTPSIHPRVEGYLDKLVSHIPDSIKTEVDRVLNLMRPNKELFRYFLSELLNKYGKTNVIGHDDVAVHIIDQYYLKGHAPWVSEESLQSLKGDADNIRPTMLGNKMPDITTYTENGRPLRLYDLKADFTILFIWDPECGTCKKFAPDIVAFYEKYKTDNVKVVTICNQAGEKFPKCWSAIKEKNMINLINTGDEYLRYHAKVRNTKVPKLYILDSDKKILLKDFPADKLAEVYESFRKDKLGTN